MKDLRERRVLREPFLDIFLLFLEPFLEPFLERRPPLITFLLLAEFALPLESILYYVLRFLLAGGPSAFLPRTSRFTRTSAPVTTCHCTVQSF